MASQERINFTRVMKKWFHSFKFALSGIHLFFKTERNARIEFVAAIVALALSLWFQIPKIELCIILLCIAGVLSAEAMNSAIEKLADLHSPDIDPRIKVVKDMAAGAVLIMAVVALVVGIIILVPRMVLVFGIG